MRETKTVTVNLPPQQPPQPPPPQPPQQPPQPPQQVGKFMFPFWNKQILVVKYVGYGWINHCKKQAYNMNSIAWTTDIFYLLDADAEADDDGWHAPDGHADGRHASPGSANVYGAASGSDVYAASRYLNSSISFHILLGNSFGIRKQWSD